MSFYYRYLTYLNSSFAYDENGIYGYKRKVDGADSVIPFSSDNNVFCCTFSSNKKPGNKHPIAYITVEDTKCINHTADEIMFTKTGKYKLQFVGLASCNNSGYRLNVYLDGSIIATYSKDVNLDKEINVTKENTLLYFTNNTYEALFGALLITK